MLYDTTTTISVTPGEYSAVTSVTTSGSATLSFIVYGDDVHTVVDHFNQAEES